jgi:hypothetical protein
VTIIYQSLLRTYWCWWVDGLMGAVMAFKNHYCNCIPIFMGIIIIKKDLLIHDRYLLIYAVILMMV